MEYISLNGIMTMKGMLSLSKTLIMWTIHCQRYKGYSQTHGVCFMTGIKLRRSDGINQNQRDLLRDENAWVLVGLKRV